MHIQRSPTEEAWTTGDQRKKNDEVVRRLSLIVCLSLRMLAFSLQAHGRSTAPAHACNQQGHLSMQQKAHNLQISIGIYLGSISDISKMHEKHNHRMSLGDPIRGCNSLFQELLKEHTVSELKVTQRKEEFSDETSKFWPTITKMLK